jgi:hypothetical protein
MNIKLLTGMALSAILLTAACGQLPPSEADRFDRERLEEDARQRRTAPVVVSNYQFTSTGNVDFRYIATLNKETQVFSFHVTRRNGEINQVVPLVRADQPTLFDALYSVFIGEISLNSSQTCLENCSSNAVIFLTRADGSSSRLTYPSLYTAAGGSANNLITSLTTYILNHLAPVSP